MIGWGKVIAPKIDRKTVSRYVPDPNLPFQAVRNIDLNIKTLNRNIFQMSITSTKDGNFSSKKNYP
jgi:hypothetical protein